MSQFTEHKREMRAGDSTWCTHCGKTWDTNDRNPPGCEPVVEVRPISTGKLRPFVKHAMDNIAKDMRKQKAAPEHIAMIGFLTAKLACYEPDSPTVKRGLEYLKNV